MPTVNTEIDMKNTDLPAIAGGKPTRKNFLYFSTPQITKDDINSVVRVMQSGWLTTGPQVTKFESKLKDLIRSKYLYAVSSCTAALHLALVVSRIRKSHEVITSPLTFSSVANVIVHVGAKPVFADVERLTGNIDPLKIEKKINKRTKAIIVTHLFGRPVNLDEIVEIAKKYKLILIEDCAHALGAYYKGKHVGSIGDFGAFSFYVTKNITTGEGGALTVKTQHWAELADVLRQHGLSRNSWKRYTQKNIEYYKLEAAGYKYNMTDMAAALGISQLKRFKKNQRRRGKIWSMYDKAFPNLPLIFPPKEDKSTVHAKHIYPLILDLKQLKVDRDKIREALALENIGTSVHFISLHLQPFYKKVLGHKPDDFPNALFLSQRLVSIPMSQSLTDKDVEDVIIAFKKVVKYFS